jgi:acetyltransferase
MHHALSTLLAPSSVALVGASARPGALGRIVFENLRAGGFGGAVYAVNPQRRRVFDAPAYPTLRAIGRPVELAVIATPPDVLPAVLDDAAAAGVRAAVIITAAPPGDPRAARQWIGEVARRAKANGIRVVGPGAFGVVRTDLGLNATFSDVAAIGGRLALVSQSGAVCTAMLDFASPMGIGFSTVVTLGEGVDVGFGELLDALLTDNATDGILMYIEDVGNARRFMSALRAAARVKPVVVLKAGRSVADTPGDGAPSEDDVFDAAMRRAGTVRVGTYTQLFAAARALAMGRIPRGDRVAIVANGRGAALLAADRALDVGVTLATLAAPTLARLENVLPDESTRGNPVDVRGTASPARYAAALEAVLADTGVDAAVALAVPRPIAGPLAFAKAAADAARASRKPVLGAWLGSVDRHDARAALEAGGIANFYTPENAVEALSYLVAYRRSQEWLLEAPASQADAQAPDFARAEALRRRLVRARDARLDAGDACALLGAFDIAHAAAKRADSLDAARAAAREFHYPVMVVRDATPAQRALAATPRALAHEFARLAGDGAPLRVVAATRLVGARAFAIRVGIDPVFGPVISMGAAAFFARARPAVMLPPLSRRLALDLVGASGPAARELDAASRDALARLALKVSTLVASLPWVRRMTLEPVAVAEGKAIVADACIEVDATRVASPHYAHMAIHPYPAELEGDVTLADGRRLRVRPIRPEDAELERSFVNALSDNTRYLRFFYQLHELTPHMLARFTQVDYDREIALVAMPRDADGRARDEFVAVARYIRAADGDAAEFAIVVADAWQGRGLGGRLMQRLCDAARGNGVRRLRGSVLRANAPMLRFVAALGFTARDDPEDAEQLVVTLDL